MILNYPLTKSSLQLREAEKTIELRKENKHGNGLKKRKGRGRTRRRKLK